MLINLENASDVVKLLDIVDIFTQIGLRHKDELEAYLDKIDELKQEVCDRDVISNGHICEINMMHSTISNLEKEIETLTTLNSELSKEIEQIKTQISCPEVIDLRETDTVIDDLREELRQTIEKNTLLQRIVNQLNAENELLEAHIDRSNQEKARLEGIIGKQEGHYQELVSQFNKVRDDANKANKASVEIIKDLRAELKATIEENRELKEKFDTLRRDRQS